jgi:PAS domain S-box-containing protein
MRKSSAAVPFDSRHAADEFSFRRLVEGVRDYAIYMLDPSGKVASWNHGARRFKGYASEEIVGQHFSRFYTEEDRLDGLPTRALDIALREGKFESEGWRVRKDGSRFWAHVVIDPIHAPDGTLLGFAKITRDLTERREAQLELERAREALFQSQKMEALGQLTGGVAHDFNNLLTAILGSLELVRKRLPGNDRNLPLIDNAMQAARRGGALTKRMLTFARRQDLRAELTSVKELIAGMTALFDHTLGPSIVLDIHCPAMLPMVVVDKNQLEMALLNLVVNARDAMPRGGTIAIAADEIELTAGTAPSVALPVGRYVRLQVRDQGHGMDAKTLARATEPFFTTKGIGKGTGLGLSMVHGFAEQLGGRLQLESREAAGTVVSLWMPVADLATRVESRGEVPVAARRRLSVLAVDDDALILTNTAAMLEDLGHQVTVAYSGLEALNALPNMRSIDLVITDQAMPGMTGTELAAQIRRDYPKLPILLATGYAELPSGEGADIPRLDKPFLQAQLDQAISDATRKQ